VIGGLSIRRAERGILEAARVQTALLQHTDAGIDRIADSFDSAEGKRVGRVDFERDHLAGQGSALYQCEPVGIAAQGLSGVFGGGYGHVCELYQSDSRAVSASQYGIQYGIPAWDLAQGRKERLMLVRIGSRLAARPRPSARCVSCRPN